MEKMFRNNRARLLAAALSASALAGCSVNSMLTDSTNVQCDSKRTVNDLPQDSTATFIVHCNKKGEIASVHVRRNYDGLSLSVDSSNANGPQQKFEPDGYTKPIPEMNGVETELSAFAAGSAWNIEVVDDQAVISGSCQGIS